MATYPTGLPSLTDPISTDYMNSPSHSTIHQEVNDEIEAIAGELGLSPSGGYADVTARLDAVDASLAGKVGSVAGANGYLLMYSGGVIVDSGVQASDFLGAVAGVASNFASLDGAGDLQDSGYAYGDLAPIAHISSDDHDGRYYTESEVDALLAAKEAAGTSAAGITAHEAIVTSSIDHNPFRVGSVIIDETNQADNQILFFHFQSNTIRYGAVNSVQQEQVEDWVAALMNTGVGPTTWAYNDGAGTLVVDLPQAVDTTSAVQFGSVNIAGNFTFPTTDGALGQIIQTNGSGTLTWTDPAAGGTGGGELFGFLLGGM